MASSATEHCRILLSAIIPSRRDLLDRALRHLSPDHFPDQTLRNLFLMLERYSEVTGAIITREALGDILARSGADPGKIALYEETYDLLHQAEADEADFRWSMEQVRELAAERTTAEALTQSMEILTRGAHDSRGRRLYGHREARAHVMQRLAEIDRDLTLQEAPEGDMRSEGDEILADYAERKKARLAGHSMGIEFGIPALDERINGLQNGELILVAGYTAEGKTSAVVQLGWHAAVVQQKNVVILTTETLRNQVRRRTIARHSCLEQFGIEGGLNSRDIKMGNLTPEQEEGFRRVVQDFDTNTAYGRYYIAQVPREATISYCESKLIRIQRMFNIDLVIMDYLALLKSERRRNSDREELSSILKESKQLATTLRDGAGVPFVSPWQVSRSARENAERTHCYTNSSLSETAEAANSADVILSLLAPLDNDKRHVNIKMQVMKNRDGERANSIEVEVDYATSRFVTQSRQDAMEALLL